LAVVLVTGAPGPDAELLAEALGDAEAEADALALGLGLALGVGVVVRDGWPSVPPDALAESCGSAAALGEGEPCELTATATPATARTAATEAITVTRVLRLRLRLLPRGGGAANSGV
jgi:hypothetical protein